MTINSFDVHDDVDVDRPFVRVGLFADVRVVRPAALRALSILETIEWWTLITNRGYAADGKHLESYYDRSGFIGRSDRTQTERHVETRSRCRSRWRPIVRSLTSRDDGFIYTKTTGMAWHGW